MLCNDEEHEVGFRALDVVSCFDWLADCVEVARAFVAGGLDALPHGRVVEESVRDDEDWRPTFEDAFGDLVFNAGEIFVPTSTAEAPVLTPEEAVASGDPDLVRAAQDLEPDESIVDMRGLPAFSRSPSSLYGLGNVRRRLGGAVVILGDEDV